MTTVTTNPGPAVTVSAHPSNVSTNQAIRLLAVLKGVNLNVTGDNVMPVINSTSYSVSNVIVTNASISLTTAYAGLFPAPAGAGTAIVSNAALSANTSASVVTQESINSTAVQTTQNLYFRVGTAQGAAATCDVYVYGYDFS